MAIAGAPAALMVGGATASGPAAGIYRIKVTDATTGESSQKKTPYMALELTVHKDPNNVAREGKKLVTQKYWFAKDDADEDKKKTMKGMLKRGPYAGFNIPWPKENKPFDPRVFLGKEAFVLLGPQKQQNPDDDVYMEVKAISIDRAKLEKRLETVAEDDTGKSTTHAPKARR